MSNRLLSGNLSDGGEVLSFYAKIYLVSVSLIVIVLPFDHKISFFAILLSLLVWVLQIRKNLRAFDVNLLGPFLIFASLYAIQVVGIVYTDNIPSGLIRLEDKLSLVFFPILFLVSAIGSREVRIIKWVFVMTTTVACIWCHGFLLRSVIVDDLPWREANAYYTYVVFVEPIKMHPTYLTVFAAFSFFLLIGLTSDRTPWIRNLVLTIALGYYGLIAYHAQSRAGIFIFLLMLLGVSIYAIKIKKSRKRIILALIVVVVLLGVGISSNKAMYGRFLTEFTNLSKNGLHENPTSTAQHVQSWYCACELIWSSHFLFGYGTGDEKDILATCYAKHDWKLMAVQKNDAHNEFLSSGIRHGVFGMGLLLFFFGYTFHRAWTTKDSTYLVFLMMFFIVSFVESTLKARTGVIFFSMFNALLFKDNYLRNRNTLSSKH